MTTPEATTPDTTTPEATTPDTTPSKAAQTGRFPAGTFSPDPQPSSASRRAVATAVLDLRLLVRNGEQLLLALVIPLAALVGGTLITVIDLPAPRITTVTPGVLALAVLSTAFTAQAITTGFDRRYGVLRRLAAAGMGRLQLVTSKVLAALVVIAGQYVVLLTLAALMGWRPAGAALPAMAWTVLLTVLGAAAFLGLALLLGGTLRAEAVLGLANLAWLLLVGLGGLIVPLSTAPGAFATLGGFTPSGALCEGLRDVLQDGAAPSLGTLAVLLGWTVIGWAGTVTWFKWQ